MVYHLLDFKVTVVNINGLWQKLIRTILDALSNLFIVTRSHMLLSFADDINIVWIDRRAVYEAFVPFKRETAIIGLTININKKKYMIADIQRRSNGDIDSEGGRWWKKLEYIVEEYIGTLVVCNNDVTYKIKRRIASADRTLSGLRIQLKSRT